MDDEEMLRNLATQLMERLGYEAVTVEDGEAAVDAYKTQMKAGTPFDAVILDLTVKAGMGGDEAMRELLRVDPYVEAVVTSGYFEDPVMSEFRSYGFKAALAKPYRMEDLAQALKNVGM